MIVMHQIEFIFILANLLTFDTKIILFIIITSLTYSTRNISAFSHLR